MAQYPVLDRFLNFSDDLLLDQLLDGFDSLYSHQRG